MARIEKVDEKLIPMALELRRECLGAIRELGEERFEGEFSNLTEDFLKNGDQTTVLAFDRENLIGCATICYFEVMPTVDHPSGKRAHIMNVYMRGQYAEVIVGEIPKGYIMDPYERQRGIIREMLNFILDEARQRGVSYVSVNTNERGRPIYKALGFGENKENMCIKF